MTWQTNNITTCRGLILRQHDFLKWMDTSSHSSFCYHHVFSWLMLTLYRIRNGDNDSTLVSRDLMYTTLYVCNAAHHANCAFVTKSVCLREFLAICFFLISWQVAHWTAKADEIRVKDNQICRRNERNFFRPTIRRRQRQCGSMLASEFAPGSVPVETVAAPCSSENSPGPGKDRKMFARS